MYFHNKQSGERYLHRDVINLNKSIAALLFRQEYTALFRLFSPIIILLLLVLLLLLWQQNMHQYSSASRGSVRLGRVA